MKDCYRLILVFFIIFLGTTICKAFDQWPDTGQKECFDDEGLIIDCPSSGEVYSGQDAQYQGISHSYTKLDENGNDLPASATSWVTVRDNVTNLIWEIKTDDGTIHDKDEKYDWHSPSRKISKFINQLNSDGFGGYSDWRMPTIKELSSLVDMGRMDLQINEDYFPNMKSTYWSSTDYLRKSNTPMAWIVNFNGGGITLGTTNASLYQVMAVRGESQFPFDRFTDNGDGTITDTTTGLMWQQSYSGGFSWPKALEYCENLELAGYFDWRLPSKNELHSIIEYGQLTEGDRQTPLHINANVFPDTRTLNYWTSTSCNKDPQQAFLANFFSGDITRSGWGKGSGFFAKAVRDVDYIPYKPVPVKVTQLSPSGAGGDQFPVFSWNRDANATWYKLLIWDGSEKRVYAQWYDASYICSEGSCSVTLESELLIGDYQWWIKSWNDYGNAWSDGMTFTVQGDDTPPSKVVHTSPSGVTNEAAPTFTWVADPASTWYKLWVGYNSTDKIFADWYDASEICSGGNCSVTLEIELMDGDYEWYIKSWNDYGKVWSDGMSFSVGE